MSEKRVLLVNPPYDIQRYMGGLGKIGWVFPPIGLTYIASYVRKNLPSSKVDIFDFQVDSRDFAELISQYRPHIVGITCQSALLYSTLDISRILKGIDQSIFVVVGGVHASIRPEDLISSQDIDAVVRGEGEEVFCDLCRYLDDPEYLKDIAGITFKDKQNEIITNPDRPIPEKIDHYPMPALDLIPLNKYRISPDLKMGNSFALILTSRGCPYNCIFCANKLLTKRTYRLRPIESVIEEIEFYRNKYSINQLIIIDDNFTVNRSRTIKLCDEFIKRGYDKSFNWWAEVRVDSLDEGLVLKMKQAGCSILSIGLESGNQRLLDLIEKGITIQQIKKAVGIISKSGIKSRASIILGLPTETKEESMKTIKFAYSLPIDQVRFSIATPFPGTKLWDIAVKEGKIDPDNIDWTRLSLMGGYAKHDPLYYPENRLPGEIKRLQRMANFFFFMRPSIIFGFLRRIRTFGDLKSLIRGFFHFLKSTIQTR